MRGLEGGAVKPSWFEGIERKLKYDKQATKEEMSQLCLALNAALWTLQFYAYRDNYDLKGEVLDINGYPDYGYRAREVKLRIHKMKGV